MLQSRRKFLLNSSKSIIDGDLLWKYINLSANEKAELAKKIGTTCDQVNDSLELYTSKRLDDLMLINFF